VRPRLLAQTLCYPETSVDAWAPVAPSLTLLGPYVTPRLPVLESSDTLRLSLLGIYVDPRLCLVPRSTLDLSSHQIFFLTPVYF
jgi:hypothetical protein